MLHWWITFHFLAKTADFLQYIMWSIMLDGWDGWMVSLIQWTWTWAKSRRWWRTGKPDVLQSMRSHRVGHDLVTEQQHVGCMKYVTKQVGLVTMELALICTLQTSGNMINSILCNLHQKRKNILWVYNCI